MAKTGLSRTDVPETLTAPMNDIADGVRGLRIGFVNVFTILNPNGSWALIDAGIPFSATAIRRWAERHHDRPPEAIVLTHGHFDHVSGAADLAEHWDVPVYAHPLESPYLTGQKEYPAPHASAGGGLMSVLSPIYPRGPVDLGKKLRLLPSSGGGEEISELPNWQIIHTPGHTPGHVSLLRSSDLTLIVGDAFCTTKPESFFDAAVTQPAELHGPPSYFTSDPAEAARSVRRLAALQPRILAPGHGRPLAGLEVKEKLDSFAAKLEAETSRGGVRRVS